MPFVDPEAAATVRELRKARGLSPETLAAEIRELADREGWKLGTVDAYTIRRIEGIEGREDRLGRVPTIRVQVVLGIYFEVPYNEIWKPGRRVKIASEPRRQATAVPA